MTNLQLVISLASFIIIALAAQRIGELFSRLHLPKISGYLVTGLLAGPFILDLIPEGMTERLLFLDEISLAFIAFAAGSELYLRELWGRFRSIGWVVAGLVVTTLGLGITAVFLLADFIPFMRTMSPTARLAVALLAGAIMVARSPSVAIAIINELRAKGPFTQIALGVTVISDVAVILIFSISSSVAAALLNNINIDIGLLILVLAEILASVLLGYIVGKLLQASLVTHFSEAIKIGLILAIGFSVYLLSNFLVSFSRDNLPVEIHLEPLLICLVGGFVVNNYTKYRLEFTYLLHEIGPSVYVVFFTLVGAGLKLDILLLVWPIALALFGVRLAAIFIGSIAGGMMAGDEAGHNRLKWMVFVTQAGVALGLAKQVAVNFPPWGQDFATTIIAIVVLNEIAGPVLFKWAITRVGEAHTRAETPAFDGTRDAIIFGLEGQSLALARQLQDHGWQVKIATRLPDGPATGKASNIDVQQISDLNLETLQNLQMERTEAIIAMLSDEENYRLCELAYEHFGIDTVVVRLNDRRNFDRFHDLGVLVVNPATAIVSLFDHLVRSPSAASLLLGTDEDQDIIDVEVRNPDLHGLALRDLKIPEELLVLSIHRQGRMLISHGYTQLKIGDRLIVVGSTKRLEEIILRFEA